MTRPDVIYYGCVLLWTAVLAAGLLYARETAAACAVLTIGVLWTGTDFVLAVAGAARRGSR